MPHAENVLGPEEQSVQYDLVEVVQHFQPTDLSECLVTLRHLILFSIDLHFLVSGSLKVSPHGRSVPHQHISYETNRGSDRPT